MKKIAFLFIITLLTLVACNNNDATKYQINGSVIGEMNGTSIYFKSKNKLDSTTIQDGKFTFTGSQEIPEFYSIVDKNGKINISVFVENLPIAVTVDANTPANSKVTGSPETDLYNEYVQKMTELKVAGESSAKLYNEAKLDLVKNMEDGEERKAKLKEIFGQEDADYLKRDSISKTYLEGFIVKNPNSAVSALIVRGSLRDFSVEAIGNYLSKLDEKGAKNPAIESIKTDFEYRKNVAVGQKFVDLNLKDTAGNDIALSSFAGKGKYVLIDFWSSGCFPCRRGNPKWVELYAQYKDKGFEIVGVSLDTEKDKWTGAINEDKLTWIHMSDLKAFNSDVAKTYQITGIPDYYLLDKEGIIIEKALGGRGAPQIQAKLKEIFGE